MASFDLARRMRSVRVRLLAIALLPSLVILPLLLGIAVTRWNTQFDAALISKVNGDLTIANQYLSRILETTQEQIVALGQSARLRDLVQTQGDLDQFLTAEQEALDLDFMFIIAGDGRIMASTSGAGFTQFSTDGTIIASALAGMPRTAIDLFSNAQMALISEHLAARSRLELVHTPNSAPTDRTVETRAMIIHSGTPVAVNDDQPAALVGGILLNRNLVFIDTINDLVYQKASLPKGSHGTATLFLDDVRASTNVRLFEGSRALGTRVSAAVRQAVLEEGRTWRDRAFVVNDWYISAYEPITDSNGHRIGMLYVGFLEAPFSAGKREAILVILLAFLVVTATSIPVFLNWAKSIFTPLERINDTLTKVADGDLSARTGLPDADHEVQRVASHLDDLLDQIQAKDCDLRAWNEELNNRVAERTKELQDANRRLEAATQQLVLSEKLAAIGEITAGVAHEIINPIAVLQGNLEIVRSVMGEKQDEAQVELRLLDEQIHRISQIVTKLLQFAKPDEYADVVEKQDPGESIRNCIPLVQHLLQKSDIVIVENDGATGLVRINPTELQQVIVNLFINAIHAMPDGGTLTVTTADQWRDDADWVTFVVADTGIGMTSETREKVFDPFYTTKRRGGMGLGLSISQTLITRQGGRIEVDSALGKGSRFTIWLPTDT